MAPKDTKKKEKKEKVFHPQSRKAGQLERTQLRKAKLQEAANKKEKRNSSQIDRYVFFFHALPDEAEALTLEELHEIIRDVWLIRHDISLEEERKARKKGRPKSVKKMKLENIKLTESEEYRTGLEVPDLTHAANVKLFRLWDQTNIQYIDLLRFIRVSSADPTSIVLSRPGKHESLKSPNNTEELASSTHVIDQEMVDAP